MSETDELVHASASASEGMRANRNQSSRSKDRDATADESTRGLGSIFPNIPLDFNYEVHTIQKCRRRSTIISNHSVSSETPSSSNQHEQQRRDFSIINEYETYMSAESFCVKNYKAFVNDYLEADGECILAYESLYVSLNL